MAQTDLLPFLPTSAAHQQSFSDNTPALYDQATGWMTYGELRDKINDVSSCLEENERSLVLCSLPNSVESVIAYLALASMGHSLLMTVPDAHDFDVLIQCYRPNLIVTPQSLENSGLKKCATPLSTLNFYQRLGESTDLHPDLFLLLLTSGSTSVNKAVRLSYSNIAHNTKAIIESLGLDNAGRALAHLPLAYSFGLSVLHTHLATGGSCVLTEDSLLSQNFWHSVREQDITHFYGVPYHFEMMDRLGLKRLKVPSLKHFMQAGGKMALPLAQRIKGAVEKIPHNALYIMYGQTEAAPRLSCFNALAHADKLESCGIALSGQHFEIIDDEIIACGPNIMMGYAQDFSDLAKGDACHGRHATGDFGKLDEQGFLFITGRKQRFAKLYGQRLALDDIERCAASLAPCLAVEGEGKIIIFAESAYRAQIGQIKNLILSQTSLQGPWVEVRTIDAFPYKANGKIDYMALTQIGSKLP
ncbi:MAG: AMP-binding protein [Alphaproteobacteria bacterium]|jgi:acyl-CoA synthetase (AMP-forming)/AMP-acid ligase II|nr:AMP-binding protein [Alphaproteobacteria bacterium]